MTDALFSFEETEPEDSNPAPIRDDQIKKVREAFVAAGMTGQDQRQQLVQSCVIRPILSLRDLHAHEVRRVITRIQDHSKKKFVQTGTAWDNREEDTWIDRL